MNKNETQKIREFGLLTGAVFAGLFGVLLPLLKHRPLPLWPWILAGILWPWALLFPQSLKPLYLLWMKIGHILGWINSRIILGIFFYLILTPMSFLMKLAGKNPLEKSKEGATTYRIDRGPEHFNNMEKPF